MYSIFHLIVSRSIWLLRFEHPPLFLTAELSAACPAGTTPRFDLGEQDVLPISTVKLP